MNLHFYVIKNMKNVPPVIRTPNTIIGSNNIVTTINIKIISMVVIIQGTKSFGLF